MKIGDAPKSLASSRIGRKQGTSATTRAASNSTSISDVVSLGGIPEAELTPKVREALVALMTEVQTLRTELSQARESIYELERLADRDPLLDLFNRRAFVRELNRSLAMIERYGMTASLIFIDLNELKTINDTLGHAAGDAALQHVSRVLIDNIRQTDVIGRLGGDEIGLLLNQADQQTGELKAVQLTKAVAAEPVQWKGESFTARISCGVVEIAKGLSADEAMERADNAMYEVKARQKSG
ncbi:GGDEF domain-containing protein [Hyphococcus formosus]|uniref:GGDEF domain-containing protein n=1 Tax=Hyphococcus formosus TaxID=3143534 RepID=UPI00398B1896